ncbi:MAG TPA: LuxR C-terminal-related transcriptional regulator [Ilumatobacteraceae bacterium]|nr:LuxR C-terminal-related transcriptional regulator [Ilumatobacteraceae bacterium]HRB04423.1 LuxR C-terminal-related transcriptional regulator [Ilumatobacteraceae bacterium]
MLRGRTGLSPVMIGRHTALSRLVGLVEAAEVRSGDGPEIALVSGEAGIGKTRLLRELIEAVPSDVTVLSAQARPGSMGRPFDVIGQLGPPGDNSAVAARGVLDAAVAKGRTLLIVEDLHWADADSVHFIEQVCMQSWPQLVIVGTYRGNDLSRKAPGGELVLRLERQHNVEQVRLERLDRAEVAGLLAAIGNGSPSSGAVEAVYRRSGGIPFVVEELVRCCGPDARIDDLKTAQLPWSLDEAVRQQLGSLPPDERRVVDALAVFGDPAPFEILREVCELGDGHLLPALRSLVTQGIVVEPDDDTFWFGHALVADAVQQQLLGRERRRLHERSFAALRAQAEPDHAALARHALGAGQFELIPAIAREGARRYLDRGASFQALRLASEALAEAPNDPELLAVATDAAWRLEFGTEALAYAEQWNAHAVTDLERVESLRFIARLHHELLDTVQRDVIVDVLEKLADSLPVGMARGRCVGAVAQLHMLADRSAKAVQWADRALADAHLGGDQWLEAQASVERASALTHLATHGDSEQALLHARDLARQVGDSVLECRALNNLMAVVAPHGALGASARAELRDASQRCGLDKLGAGMLALWEAEAALASGDMHAMRQALAEAGQHWGPDSREFLYHRARLATLRIEEGLVAEALAAVHEMEVALAGTRELGVTERRVILAGAALEGRRADVEREFDAIVASPRVADQSDALWFMLETVQAALQAGIPAARVRAEFVDGWAKSHTSRGFLVRHAEGMLLMAAGDHAGAAAVLGEVLREPDPMLYVPSIGSLRTVHASAMLATGDRAGALAVARQAVADLKGWPGWRRDRAEALVRRLEGSGARADGELTGREREVAALIAEGLTNSQLAERLFISPKTAAVHVSNILMKLGLSSRAEVAAWAVRHGIVLQPG